jgi:hypothetical protein
MNIEVIKKETNEQKITTLLSFIFYSKELRKDLFSLLNSENRLIMQLYSGDMGKEIRDDFSTFLFVDLHRTDGFSLIKKSNEEKEQALKTFYFLSSVQDPNVKKSIEELYEFSSKKTYLDLSEVQERRRMREKEIEQKTQKISDIQKKIMGCKHKLK